MEENHKKRTWVKKWVITDASSGEEEEKVQVKEDMDDNEYKSICWKGSTKARRILSPDSDMESKRLTLPTTASERRQTTPVLTAATPSRSNSVDGSSSSPEEGMTPEPFPIPVRSEINAVQDIWTEWTEGRQESVSIDSLVGVHGKPWTSPPYRLQYYYHFYPRFWIAYIIREALRMGTVGSVTEPLKRWK